MYQQESKVRVPEVAVKLHWPSAGCPECAGECTEVSKELYRCESCHRVNLGRTKVIAGRLYALR